MQFPALRLQDISLSAIVSKLSFILKIVGLKIVGLTLLLTWKIKCKQIIILSHLWKDFFFYRSRSELQGRQNKIIVIKYKTKSFPLEWYLNQPQFFPASWGWICTAQHWFCWTHKPEVSPRIYRSFPFLIRKQRHHTWMVLLLLWPVQNKMEKTGEQTFHFFFIAQDLIVQL